jgi:nucleoid-associated protein YgaU
MEVVMGFFDFIKEAGEKLFHGSAAAAPADASADAGAAKAADDAKGQAIQDYIAQQGLSATALSVQVEGDVAKVFGVAPDQATREKIILCCGNVGGIKSVDDQMSVNTESEESQWHTVERGDTLSAIAKKFYGDANKYQAIFEANKPMLSNPDKIYPGQKLRIPAV